MRISSLIIVILVLLILLFSGCKGKKSEDLGATQSEVGESMEKEPIQESESSDISESSSPSPPPVYPEP